MIPKNLSVTVALSTMLGAASLFTWFLPYAIAEITANQVANNNSPTSVASIIQGGDSNETQSPADLLRGNPLQAPPLEDPSQPLQEEIYNFFMGENSEVLMKVAAHANQQASVYINDREVVRFREEVAGIAPWSRSQILADRLQRYLKNGNDPDTIKPGKKGGLVVIKMGGEVLTTVDAHNARAAGMQRDQLALVWTNQIRENLGAEKLDVKDCPELFPDGGFYGTGQVQTGQASWYGPGFNGRRTASGSRFNQNAMTAAHRTLPFGTMVKVTNHRNQKSCVVKINDRGPYAHGRIIDLSKGAAQAIGITGVGKVTLEVVKPNS